MFSHKKISWENISLCVSLQAPLWRLKLGHHLPWAEFWTVAMSPQFLQCTPGFFFSLLPILLLSQEAARLWLPVKKTPNFPKHQQEKCIKHRAGSVNLLFYYYGISAASSVWKIREFFFKDLTRPFVPSLKELQTALNGSLNLIRPHLPPRKHHRWDRVLQVFREHYCHDDGKSNLLYLNP